MKSTPWLNDKIPLLKNKCLLSYFELVLEMEKLWDVAGTVYLNMVW